MLFYVGTRYVLLSREREFGFSLPEFKTCKQIDSAHTIGIVTLDLLKVEE
jgi:hypothetical protein